MSLMTEHSHDTGRLYRDYRNQLFGALRARFDPSSLSDQDLEDILQDLFEELQKRKSRITAQQTFGSLLTRVHRDALDFLRRRNSQKGGGKIRSSLELALETGIDFPALNLTPKLEALEMADLVIAASIPGLSERELILIRHIRAAAPYSEMSLMDLATSLSEEQRSRFLPVRRKLSAQDETTFIVRQVSRSRSSLWRRLRSVRRAMTAQGV